MKTLIGYSVHGVPHLNPFAPEGSVIIDVGWFDKKGSNGFLANELLKDPRFRLSTNVGTGLGETKTKCSPHKYDLLEIFHSCAREYTRNADRIFHIYAADSFVSQSKGWLRHMCASDGIACISKTDMRHIKMAAAKLGFTLPPLTLAYPSMPVYRPTTTAGHRPLNYLWSNVGHIPRPWLSYRVYGWIGYPQERKNITKLAEMFYLAFQDATDVMLLLIVNDNYYGHYREHRDLVRIMQRPAAPPMAIVKGPLDDVSYFEFINGIDTYVSAHQYEGFGMPIIQAARQGANIVITNQGGAAELLPNRCLVSGSVATVMQGDYVDLLGVEVATEPFIARLKQPHKPDAILNDTFASDIKEMIKPTTQQVEVFKDNIAFVLVTCGGLFFLQALHSILKYHPTAHIILVQSGNLPDAKPTLPAGNITHVHVMRHLHTASARNVGLSYVKEKTVGFLDADAKLLTPVKFSINEVQGGLISYKNPPVVWSAGAFINEANVGEHRYLDCRLNLAALRQTTEVDYIPGCFMVWPTQALSDIGGFPDDIITSYYDDVIACYKARAKGWPIIYTPRMRAFHDTQYSRITTHPRDACHEFEYSKGKFIEWRNKALGIPDTTDCYGGY